MEIYVVIICIWFLTVDAYFMLKYFWRGTFGKKPYSNRVKFLLGVIIFNAVAALLTMAVSAGLIISAGR